MKPNLLQKEICDVIKCEASFWQKTNDITSPTHLGDIYMDVHLTDLPEETMDKFEELLKDLYWFVRKFDNKNE